MLEAANKLIEAGVKQGMRKRFWARNRPRIRARVTLHAPFLTALAFIGLLTAPGDAQQINSASNPLSQLQQAIGGANGLNGLGSVVNPQQDLQDTTQRPALPTQSGPPPVSRLEQIMSAKAGAKLTQFGYDQLGTGRSVTIPQAGAVQDDYVLGAGDELIVSLTGQENAQLRVTVDRGGQVSLPRLAPIPAAGRTFAAFRQDLQNAVHRAYISTDVFASIARVRQISVLVSGEVNVPGQRNISGLSSVVDALLLSGGIKKTGSLRNIRIQRGSQSLTIDLYSVLTGIGSANLARLADGDRILVPPLGKTVAVTGLVRTPGIFELPSGRSSIAARALMSLAGGTEIRGDFRNSVLRVSSGGVSQMVSLAGTSGNVGDSEILFVQMNADQTAGQATLSGGTGLAGAYPIAPQTKLSDMLKAPGALGQSPYTLFGIIVRKDPGTLLRTLVAFTPAAVLNGKENIALQTDDLVRPLSVNETTLLSNVVRAYLEKLAADQAILRNPLTDQNAATAATRPSLPSAGSLPQSVPTLPVTKVDELSFAIDQLTSAPADVQRADIIALMDLRAPGTLGVGSQEAVLERQDQTGRSPQNIEPALMGNGAMPVPAQVPSGGVDQNLPANAQTPVAGNAYGMPGAYGPNNAYGPYSPHGPYGAQGYGNGLETQNVEHPATQLAQNFQEIPLSSGRYVSNREIKTFGELVRQLDVDPLVLINFLIEHRARLDGAVRGPGSYFVGPNVALNDLVQAAGGTINWSDESGVELITTAIDRQTGRAATERQTLPLRQATLASYTIRARDTLHFNQVFTNVGIGSATVQGEVRFAGSYPIVRGEHLSELLVRAGGLTNTAYPYGAIFLRKSAADTEHQGYLRAANEIENELVIAMTRVGNDKIDPGTFGSMQAFVNELRTQKAVGRISITADPSVLASKPELDPLLEAGDLIYVPQRPSTISVLGQVSQPGSFPYRPGLTLEDYVAQAGGYAATSDESDTFIVLPDGSARKVEKSWLSFSSNDLPPGSTIVVPRDVTPLDTRQLILDVSSIFSQFAVSLASLAVLAKQ